MSKTATKKRRAPFAGGRNVALKLPPHQYEAMLGFYRDTLGLKLKQVEGGGAFIAFGPIQLWLDKCPQLSQAEIWLEVVTADSKAAARKLKAAGITRCDAVEELPKDYPGFWIAAPAGIVHLVSEEAP